VSSPQRPAATAGSVSLGVSAVHAGLASALALSPTEAAADDDRIVEPVLAAEPRVMREPGEPLQIPDAADERDAFDLETSLVYRIDVETATIRQGGVDVAGYSRLASLLEPQARIGIWRNVAGTIRLPVALADRRELSTLGDGPSTVTFGGETLFPTKFAAPSRSGLRGFASGLLVGVFDQSRTPASPTWTLGLDVEAQIGNPLHACVRSPPEGQESCADPLDQDRDGVRDPEDPPLEPPLDAGMTRESLSIELETRLSRRIRFLEPFGILSGRVELPFRDSPLLRGAAFALPPVRTSLVLGLGIVPWENRERWSRVWFDARVRGAFLSAGPDFSPVFDAVGTSTAPSVRALTSADGRVVGINGVMRRGAHGIIGASTSFSWRASQLIRLGLDLDFEHVTSHALGEETCSAECSPFYRESLNAAPASLSLGAAYSFAVGANGGILF
jgi:hypothetical protein